MNRKDDLILLGSHRPARIVGAGPRLLLTAVRSVRHVSSLGTRLSSPVSVGAPSAAAQLVRRRTREVELQRGR
jgi:hypothetical protein